MGESRAKKGRKAQWELHLGLRDLIFAALGITGLVMLSFALGTMAGRGDLYRLLVNWGMLKAENQPFPAPWPASTVSLPVVSAPNPAVNVSPAEPSSPALASVPAPVQPHPPSPPVPAQGPPAAVPASPAQGKKPQPVSPDKGDKLENIRREVANKLKFQNSLDPAATRKAGEAGKPRDTAKGQPGMVLVAKYRDGAQARQKLAQLQKQGEKVLLREGKDGEGGYFALYRQVTPGPAKAPSLSQARPQPKTKPETAPTRTSQP